MMTMNRSDKDNFNPRPYVKGKFIYIGKDKFFIKGVTYGTFSPDENGSQFPSQQTIDNDFAQMRANGVNTVRTYTPPPAYLLDCARHYGLKVMIGLPWEQHIAFLEEKPRRNDILDRVGAYVQSVKNHPAILCYTVGNEIPSTVVRWYGHEAIEQFIQCLYRKVKEIDPEGLVTYVNYPTTEYLDLSFLDFFSFNVYLETEVKLHEYLRRLHNLCGDLPLVLAEIGLDSIRNGEEKQSDVLRWQIKKIFSEGCAGLFVFAWTDEWWRGGAEIEDWDFGIVDRNRKAKKALPVVRNLFENGPFSFWKEKFISVVVCSYNGSSTIRDCLDGLMRLHYSNFEVIVVNDGSTDGIENIVEGFPVKLINTENRGLSNARNTGMFYAGGEIVAYIDDDAFPDRDWLNYLNIAFHTTAHAAIGGPNLVPAADGKMAKAIAAAPGGPIHVLLTDEIAEHIPGCNMAFRRRILLDSGGFDGRYRAAGDDVDMCWRIQDNGHTIGFHPSAIVWHHRRSSIRAYWKQQKGYGKAEALLESKWPQRYNSFGHYSWGGSVYGGGHTLPLKKKAKRIFYGTWGNALFQSVYETSANNVSFIPLMPEWLLFVFISAMAGLLGFIWPVLFWALAVAAASLTIYMIQAYRSAQVNCKRHAEINNPYYRLLVSVLHMMQPAARLYGRMSNGLTPWRKRGHRAVLAEFSIRHQRLHLHWSEKWYSPEHWIKSLENGCKSLKASVKKGGDFDAWDLRVCIDLFSCLKLYVLVEEHGGGKQYVRIKNKPKISTAAVIICLLAAFAALLSAAFAGVIAATPFALVAIGVVVRVLAGISYSREIVSMAVQKFQQQEFRSDGLEEKSAIKTMLPEEAVSAI